MIAVFALTERGAVLAKRIGEIYPQAHLYIPTKHKETIQGKDIRYYDTPLKNVITNCWPQYDYFVFIMAAGIVVRTIAPLLENKLKDPAVMVVDEKGQNVISLLSGHFGGANEFTNELAKELKANAVITTASDVEGIPAFDDLARKNNCVMENVQGLRDIAAAMLEGKLIALYSTVNIKLQLPDNVKIIDDLAQVDVSNFAGLVCITEKADINTDNISRKNITFVILRPKNIIIGIGCRKGMENEKIMSALSLVLEKNNISEKSVVCLATIELKKDEPGLVQAGTELNVPLKWVTADEINKIESNFTSSEFVKTQVGVGAVCEPAAWLMAVKPILLTTKTAVSGVTVAVVKDLATFIA